jgi:hypothetical protein
MNYTALTEILTKKIGAYKLLLVDMLTENRAMAAVISKTYYDSNVSIIEWIESIEANSFFDFKSELWKNIKPRLGFDQVIYDELELQAIANLIGKRDKNYFGEIEFADLESLKSLSPIPYYIYDDKIFKELDTDFFKLIDGYRAIGGNTRQKVISEKVSIKLKYASNRLGYESIETYCLPEVYIAVNENDYWVCEEADITSLLFLGNNCFAMFKRNSLLPILNDFGNIISFKYKTDEPVKTINSLANKYVVTNSEDAKESYNLFVNLTLSLSALFFTLFEKWVVSELAEELELSNDL